MARHPNQGHAMDTMSINKAQLAQALGRWESLARSGGCDAPADVAKLPVDEVATRSANALWTYLQAAAQSVEGAAGQA